MSSAAYSLGNQVTSSEGITAMRLINQLAKDDYFFHAVGANVSSEGIPQNCRFYNVRVPGDDLRLKSLIIMNAVGVYYSIRNMMISRSIVKKEDVQIIHHMFPSSAHTSFSLIPIVSSNFNRPFVFGPISESVHPNMLPLQSSMHEMNCKRADVIIVQTSHLEAEYAARYGKEKVKRIPLGVDVDAFPYSEPPPGIDGLEIVTVANLHHMKGVDIFIRAVPSVLKNLPNTKFRIIGDGPDSSNLKALVKNLGIETSVHFEGKVPNSEISKYYRKAAIFCSTSREEAFGRAIIESMSTGRPVIATATSGALEIVEKGKDGIIIPINDSDALSEAITRLLTDEALRKKMSIAGRKSAEAKFDWNIICKRYLETYQGLL
jgi:glycosyltransferase involved in cell wall biosynthesis